MGEQTADIPFRPSRNPNNVPAPSAAPSLRRSTSSTLETNRRSTLQNKQQFSPQLKWHNTLQQDFTGQKGQTGNSEKNLSPPANVRKRHSGSFDKIDAIILSHVHHRIPETDSLSPVEPSQRLSSSPLPSPSKRQRALGTNVKTPTKSGQLSGQSGNVKSSGSGMQTPPPSSTATARKRGRPQKKKSFQNPPSSATTQVLSPPHTSPTKASDGDGPSLGMLHNKGSLQIPVPDIRFPSSVPDTFDEYLSKENAWNGGLDYANGMGVVSTEGESSDAYDWSSMRANVSDVSIDGLDVFGSLARDGQSSPLYDDPSDSIHFSFPDFDDDLLEKSILPLDVDPNLIFSSTGTSVASSMRTDEIREIVKLGTASQPYQHQHLQHLREQELELQRQRILQEKLMKEKRRQERAVTASGGRGAGSQRSLLKHSMSDSLLSRPIRRLTAKAADFDAAVTKNSVASARKAGLEKRNATPPPLVPPPRSVRKGNTGRTPRGQGPITVKLPKMRTEVTLEISPGGRAKTETTIVYESSDTEADEVQIWDSFEESDSSFDDDEPRGLGPDGKEYIVYRERSRLGPVLEGRNALQRHSGTIFEKPAHAVPPPRTPTRRSPVKLASSTGKKGFKGFAAITAAAATATSGRLDSSPRLPTPLRSSPPASIGRHLRESVRRASGSSFSSSRMSMLGTPALGSMHEVSDESEAETVVDGTDIVNLAEDEDEEDDGDAMAALKKVMLGRRRSEASLDRTPTKARPGSAVKPKFFSSGSTTTGQGQRSVTRHSQIHPGLLQTSAVKKKLFVDQAAIGNSIVRPRRKMADGGFPEASTSLLATSGSGRLTPVRQRPRSDSRKENIAVEEDSTRCVCKKTNE
ncbi:hypothetical protein L873DRAFT_233315 [Choiromyces venosus 120613-1]|uniref:Uncharacterized protein n=1 Tax=Choiromyces venosus 120613-1 TaxID=1336337 RepID=A0A3N4JYM0_9PEZI|nr:hypothetical protein L873DRAFT_233315 [Choiromyces venosus 120613-1]